MGRFVKNHRVQTGSFAIRLPEGTNTAGPQYPVEGQLKFNTEMHKFEVFYAGAWNQISSSRSGRVIIEKDSFVGNGATTAFTMTKTYNVGDDAMVLVFVGNIFQNPGVAYVVNGNQIIFTSAPPIPTTAEDNIVVMHNFNSVHTPD